MKQIYICKQKKHATCVCPEKYQGYQVKGSAGFMSQSPQIDSATAQQVNSNFLHHFTKVLPQEETTQPHLLRCHLEVTKGSELCNPVLH